MLTIRRVEEAAAKAYAQGKIGGFLHLGIGQEAVCVGAIAALAPDRLRRRHLSRARPLPRQGRHAPRRCLAELYGKSTGASKGMGGSMHLFDAKNRMLGGYGIVGGHVPLAAGVGVRVEVSRRRRRHAVLLRRRLGAAGRVPRGHLAGRPVEAADRVHLREQPVLDGHAALPHAGGPGRDRARGRLRGGARSLRRRRRAARAASASPRRSSARARTSSRRWSRSSPIASAATRCPIPATTAPRTRSRSGRSATRCRWRASGCSRTRRRRGRARFARGGDQGRGAGAVRFAEESPDADRRDGRGISSTPNPDTDPRKM